ncbi:MAG: ArnT family glycosyltransferase [Bacteroidota bacterium]
MNRIKKIIHEDYGFFLLLLLFTLVKIPFLSLPYFWDEAWAYANATHFLAENKLSLMPDAAPEYFTRGHPLLVHNTVAFFMKNLGATPFVAHSVMLCFSLLLLGVIYFSVKSLSDRFSALLITAILMCMPSFFTQSVLVLSEIPLILFSILMYAAYSKKNMWLYMLFSVLALLTKESAIVVVFTFFVFFLIENRFVFRNYFSFSMAGILFPFIFWGAYLLLQKSVKGWYVYPEHADLISFSFPDIIKKCLSYLQIVFFNNGNIAWTFIATGLLAWNIFVKKQKPESKEIKLQMFCTLFIIFFLLFSSLNFFSSRYVMIVSVAWMIMTVVFAGNLLKEIKWKFLLVVIPVLFSVISFRMKNIQDTSPGYRDGVKVMQDIIPALENMNVYNEKIYAPFLIRENLFSPSLGYRTNTLRFTLLQNSPEGAQYAVTSNFEDDEMRKSIESSTGWEKKKEFSVNKATTAIYSRKSESEPAR